MNEKQKVFAFQLAVKESEKQATEQEQFKARDGVSVAGCTGVWGRGPGRFGSDSGVYC